MQLGELRTHLKNLLNRSDITDALADTFISQGIARIQRSLRIPAMEKTHTYNLAAETSFVAIPNDYLEGIELIYDQHVLQRIPVAEIQDLRKAGAQGNPHYYAREGGTFLLDPVPASGSLKLNYYANFPAMTLDSDENVLAAIAGDLIIYAALTYAADYYLDERSVLFEEKYLYFMTELQEQANDAETANTAIRPSYNL